ncbi:unnamed protein product [Rotaria sordida]|uniref:F-box domain-containing protein n=1 Tax=Rotaria sordida TaxID=392033 RepID=A0A815B141_9BILA|nr:unnamed protein product [Rotaria sordida]CAF1546943.1 unnamed protein product [Rotaria sordida]
MVIRFEDIPDELFLLVCRHLTWLEVMNVFYLLNIRFRRTIADYCYYIYLPLNLTYVQFKEYRDKWLPMLKPHTLHIQKSIHYTLLHPLFEKCLSSLDTLVIWSVKSNLNPLPPLSLKYLRIHFDSGYDHCYKSIYHYFLNASSQLTHIHITVKYVHGIRVWKNEQCLNGPPSIEPIYLPLLVNVNLHVMLYDDIVLLLPRLINVKYLQLTISKPLTKMRIMSISTLKRVQLDHLIDFQMYIGSNMNINEQSVPFSEFVVMCLPITLNHQLQRYAISVEISQFDSTYLNGNVWHQTLLSSTNNLSIVRLNLSLPVGFAHHHHPTLLAEYIHWLPNVSLLYKQYRSYHFNFNSISKHNFDIICSQHLSFITDQIISLSLFDNENTSGQINLFRFYILSFS